MLCVLYAFCTFSHDLQCWVNVWPALCFGYYLWISWLSLKFACYASCPVCFLCNLYVFLLFVWSWNYTLLSHSTFLPPSLGFFFTSRSETTIKTHHQASLTHIKTVHANIFSKWTNDTNQFAGFFACERYTANDCIPAFWSPCLWKVYSRMMTFLLFGLLVPDNLHDWNPYVLDNLHDWNPYVPDNLHDQNPHVPDLWPKSPCPWPLTEIPMSLTTSMTEIPMSLTTSMTEISMSLTTSMTEIPMSLTTSMTEISMSLTTSMTEIPMFLTTSMTQIPMSPTTSMTEIPMSLTTSMTEISMSLTTSMTEIPNVSMQLPACSWQPPWPKSPCPWQPPWLKSPCSWQPPWPKSPCPWQPPWLKSPMSACNLCVEQYVQVWGMLHTTFTPTCVWNSMYRCGECYTLHSHPLVCGTVCTGVGNATHYTHTHLCVKQYVQVWGMLHTTLTPACGWLH